MNVFIAIHTNERWLATGGNMPIILLAVLVCGAIAEQEKQTVTDALRSGTGRKEKQQ